MRSFSSRIVAVATVLVMSGTVGEAFTTPAAHTLRAIPARQTELTPLKLVPPPQDVTGMAEMVQQSTQWLAEAAAADQADVGWWGQYINFFKIALEFVHSTIEQPLKSVGIQQTWGPSIALFTMLIRSALIPLSIQQNQSAEYMKALKPYVSEINEKFKNNEDAKNRAVGKLYQDANQNPLAGCLTSLAQLPIFLGLYRGVRNLALAGELNEPFLWIPSLQGPTRPPEFRDLDWLTTGWHAVAGSSLPEPLLGWETTLAFLIMPIILIVLQSTTMQVLQPPVDEDASDDEKQQQESTQTVLKFLPLMIGFFSLQVPAGLTIYWFTTNIFTLTQSLAVKAYFAANPPEINLPDYWDSVVSGNVDDLSPEERRKAASAGLRVGPSLEDLQLEAKFHVLVERGEQSIRTESPAWKRVAAANGNVELPNELAAWVKEGPQTVAATVNGNTSGATTNAATEEHASSSSGVKAEAPDAAAPYFAKSTLKN